MKKANQLRYLTDEFLLIMIDEHNHVALSYPNIQIDYSLIILHN